MTAPIRLAVISNEQTPYRVNLHRRIVRECPEIELWSVYTHEVASSPWEYQDTAEIRPVMFGRGEHSATQASPRNALREWRKGGRIIDWMTKQNVAAVILLGYNDPARLRILRWCQANERPCFLFGDSNILGDQQSGWKSFVKRIVLPRVLDQCTGVFHCGRLGHQYFTRYGVPGHKLFAVPYEPDYEQIAAGSTQTELVKRQHGLSQACRHILFSGRLVPVKRADLLLDTFVSLATERPDWRLVVAGDGPLRHELQARVPEQFRGSVIWTGFIADPSELAALYAACDVLVLPSDYEPWGVVVTEAAMHMALVTSSSVGAGADLVIDGVNGRIFETGSQSQLRDCLLDVTRPERIDPMKVASRQVLDVWRKQSDPVIGLRRALRAAGFPIVVQLEPASHLVESHG